MMQYNISLGNREENKKRFTQVLSKILGVVKVFDDDEFIIIIYTYTLKVDKLIRIPWRLEAKIILSNIVTFVIIT